MLQAEIRRQRLIASLIAERKANHLTQAQVAAEMNVSQSVVAEIESSKADVRYSTLDRYAEAVTKQFRRGARMPSAGSYSEPWNLRLWPRGSGAWRRSGLWLCLHSWLSSWP
jgi:transcriptional regulator with XRE-family HTH domain